MVVGGDGSVNEVVNGIAGRDDVEIAVIARGTGWDFARSLGLPRRVDRAVAVALGPRSRTIDLGRVAYRPWAGGEKESFFANVASVGMSGAIAQRANETSKALGMKICPDAKTDDGAFDVLLIGDLTKRDLLLTLPKTFRGTHLPHPKAELLRGAHVTVEAREPLPLELDGEQPGTTPARFEIVPRALRVRVP